MEDKKIIRGALNDLDLHINKILESAEVEKEALNLVYNELEENLNIAQRAINGYTEISEIKKDAISTLSRIKDQIDPTYNSYIDQFGHFLEDVSKINSILEQKHDIEKFAQIHARSLEHRGRENKAREILFYKMEKLQKNLHELEFTQNTLLKIQELLQQKFAEFTADIKKLKSIANQRIHTLRNDWTELKKTKNSKNKTENNADINDIALSTISQCANKHQELKKTTQIARHITRLYDSFRQKIENLINSKNSSNK